METHTKKRTSCGRPKKLSRSYTIETAMQAYWEHGVKNVSLNEVCRLSKISKSSFYHEFGSEDTFMQAVLEHYENSILKTLWQSQPENTPLKQRLAFMAEIFSSHDNPNSTGCLLAKMLNNQAYLGQVTVQQIHQVQHNIIQTCATWIDQAKQNGELSTSTDTQILARYLYAQINNAANMQAQGEPPKHIQSTLELAFSIFK